LSIVAVGSIVEGIVEDIAAEDIAAEDIAAEDIAAEDIVVGDKVDQGIEEDKVGQDKVGWGIEGIAEAEGLDSLQGEVAGLQAGLVSQVPEETEQKKSALRRNVGHSECSTAPHK